jgi:peptidoglycan hydrolase CwlO-like protein
MISTNKENGKAMTPSRMNNLQEQQKTVTNDITEKTAEIKKMQEELKQYNSSFTELQKTLNNPTYN